VAGKSRRISRRTVIGLGVAVLLAALLLLIPYKTMREERMFALGSKETFGQVVSVADTRNEVAGAACLMVRYRFVDNSGVSRQGKSCLPVEKAEALAAGRSIPVTYATGAPEYSEAASAVQDPVKRWIRKWARGE
jgi:hypothetical protein